jgi:hypothetical protein
MTDSRNENELGAAMLPLLLFLNPVSGGIAGWVLVSLMHGKMMPALSGQTIIAVLIGSVIGGLGAAVAAGLGCDASSDSSKGDE